MGNQLNFYLAPQDIADFESRARKDGVVILMRTSADGQSAISETSCVAFPGGVRADAYLVRAIDIRQVAYQFIERQNHWVVDSLKSPVVEFYGCHFGGGTLKIGRLFYEIGHLDDNGRRVERSQEFLRSAQRLFKLVRKMSKRDPALQAYVGPAAAQWKEQTAGRFIDFSHAPKVEEPKIIQ
jgi:hypothetical protein